MMKYLLLLLVLDCTNSFAQTNWLNIDSQYTPLPASVHVYKSADSVEGRPNIMYYVVADLNSPVLKFSADTSLNRRLTPTQYYAKNHKPLLVVNAGFFSFATNRNLNAVVINDRVVAYNEQNQKGKGADSLKYLHPFYGTFGILRDGKADIAWTYSDSSSPVLYASQKPVPYIISSHKKLGNGLLLKIKNSRFKKWHVMTAVGGGPVLLQGGKVKVTNNEERKFPGKAIEDRHPRTSIGYTKDNKLVVFVCDGRSDSAAGLTLPQMATILQKIGCVEALNLDGGGSSCLLVNGKEVNTPSSKGIQRAVPSVFLIRRKEPE